MISFDDFFSACKNGDIDVVRNVLSYGDEIQENLVNRIDIKCFSYPLHEAIKEGHYEIAEMLIKEDVCDLNLVDKDYNRPIDLLLKISNKGEVLNLMKLVIRKRKKCRVEYFERILYTSCSHYKIGDTASNDVTLSHYVSMLLGKDIREFIEDEELKAKIFSHYCEMAGKLTIGDHSGNEKEIELESINPLKYFVLRLYTHFDILVRLKLGLEVGEVEPSELSMYEKEMKRLFLEMLEMYQVHRNIFLIGTFSSNINIILDVFEYHVSNCCEKIQNLEEGENFSVYSGFASPGHAIYVYFKKPHVEDVLDVRRNLRSEKVFEDSNDEASLNYSSDMIWVHVHNNGDGDKYHDVSTIRSQQEVGISKKKFGDILHNYPFIVTYEVASFYIDDDDAENQKYKTPERNGRKYLHDVLKAIMSPRDEGIKMIYYSKKKWKGKMPESSYERKFIEEVEKKFRHLLYPRQTVGNCAVWNTLPRYLDTMESFHTHRDRLKFHNWLISKVLSHVSILNKFDKDYQDMKSVGWTEERIFPSCPLPFLQWVLDDDLDGVLDVELARTLHRLMLRTWKDSELLYQFNEELFVENQCMFKSGGEVRSCSDAFELFCGSHDKSVFLLLGESGSGKTTFCYRVFSEYARRSEQLRENVPYVISDSVLCIIAGDQRVIPILIRLNQYESSLSGDNIVLRHLKSILGVVGDDQNNYNDRVLRKLMKEFAFLVILDGFDEMRGTSGRISHGATPNIVVPILRELNEESKVVITCLTSSLAEKSGKLPHELLFLPSSDLVYGSRGTEGLFEVSLLPFDEKRVDEYIGKFCDYSSAVVDDDDISLDPVELKRMIDGLPKKITELMSNPFLLHHVLEGFGEKIRNKSPFLHNYNIEKDQDGGYNNNNNVKTRFEVFRSIMDLMFEKELERLKENFDFEGLRRKGVDPKRELEKFSESLSYEMFCKDDFIARVVSKELEDVYEDLTDDEEEEYETEELSSGYDNDVVTDEEERRKWEDEYCSHSNKVFKKLFHSRNDKIKLGRSGCTFLQKVQMEECESVRKFGNVTYTLEAYHFSHKSIGEYFVASYIIHSLESQLNSQGRVNLKPKTLKNLNRSLVNFPPSILEFLVEYIQEKNPSLKEVLLLIVVFSRDRPNFGIVASNSMTLLNLCNFSFYCLDLSRVNIPNADLSEAIIDDVNFTGANMSRVVLRRAHINKCVFKDTDLRFAYTGELPSKSVVHDKHFYESIDNEKFALSSSNIKFSQDSSFSVAFDGDEQEIFISRLTDSAEKKNDNDSRKELLKSDDIRVNLVTFPHQCKNARDLTCWLHMKNNHPPLLSMFFSPNSDGFFVRGMRKESFKTPIRVQTKGFFSAQLDFADVSRRRLQIVHPKFPLIATLEEKKGGSSFEIRVRIWSYQLVISDENIVSERVMNFKELDRKTIYLLLEERNEEKSSKLYVSGNYRPICQWHPTKPILLIMGCDPRRIDKGKRREISGVVYYDSEEEMMKPIMVHIFSAFRSRQQLMELSYEEVERGVLFYQHDIDLLPSIAASRKGECDSSIVNSHSFWMNSKWVEAPGGANLLSVGCSLTYFTFLCFYDQESIDFGNVADVNVVWFSISVTDILPKINLRKLYKEKRTGSYRDDLGNPGNSKCTCIMEWHPRFPLLAFCYCSSTCDDSKKILSSSSEIISIFDFEFEDVSDISDCFISGCKLRKLQRRNNAHEKCTTSWTKLAWHPTKSILASSDDRGNICLWNTDGKKSDRKNIDNIPHDLLRVFSCVGCTHVDLRWNREWVVMPEILSPRVYSEKKEDAHLHEGYLLFSASSSQPGIYRTWDCSLEKICCPRKHSLHKKKKVYLWPPHLDQPEQAILHASEKEILEILVGPESHDLISLLFGDGRVEVWNAKKCEKIFTYPPPAQQTSHHGRDEEHHHEEEKERVLRMKWSDHDGIRTGFRFFIILTQKGKEDGEIVLLDYKNGFRKMFKMRLGSENVGTSSLFDLNPLRNEFRLAVAGYVGNTRKVYVLKSGDEEFLSMFNLDNMDVIGNIVFYQGGSNYSKINDVDCLRWHPTNSALLLVISSSSVVSESQFDARVYKKYIHVVEVKESSENEKERVFMKVLCTRELPFVFSKKSEVSRIISCVDDVQSITTNNSSVFSILLENLIVDKNVNQNVRRKSDLKSLFFFCVSEQESSGGKKIDISWIVSDPKAEQLSQHGSLARKKSRMCSYCRVNVGTKMCSKCKKRRYCCVECQKKDWKRQHKYECQKLSRQEVSPSSSSSHQMIYLPDSVSNVFFLKSPFSVFVKSFSLGDDDDEEEETVKKKRNYNMIMTFLISECPLFVGKSSKERGMRKEGCLYARYQVLGLGEKKRMEQNGSTRSVVYQTFNLGVGQRIVKMGMDSYRNKIFVVLEDGSFLFYLLKWKVFSSDEAIRKMMIVQVDNNTIKDARKSRETECNYDQDVGFFELSLLSSSAQNVFCTSGNNVVETEKCPKWLKKLLEGNSF